jgi:hypothetical protein
MPDRNSYTIEDYYLSYKEYVSDNRLYQVSKAKFREILNDYFKYLATELIDNSKEIRLPARMGTLCVIKKKPKRYDFTYLRVDFHETKTCEKTVLHLNEHSDGYNYQFFWSKHDMLIKCKSMYELVMSRANKRRLAKEIKENKQDYIEK